MKENIYDYMNMNMNIYMNKIKQRMPTLLLHQKKRKRKKAHKTVYVDLANRAPAENAKSCTNIIVIRFTFFFFLHFNFISRGRWNWL